MDPMLADARRLPKVMEELDRWILQAPDSAQALIWKGYALDRRNLSDKAERLLRLAALRGRVRRDPELSAALAFALDRRGESVAARRLFGQAALIARRRGERHLYSQILAQLAVSYRREGRTSEADSYDRRAREADVPAFAEDI